MPLDSAFLESVSELYVPEMGTDAMAPLLYSLVRFQRPRRILEAGMGYTSPFLAKALADNVAAFRAEKTALVAKTTKYLADIDALGAEARVAAPGAKKAQGLAAVYAPKPSVLAERRSKWMFADPSLARPGYYVDDYAPRLHCVDDLSNPHSSAPRVLAKIEAAGLTDFVTVHSGDFWSFDLATISGGSTFDFVWIDLAVSVNDVLSFLDGPHWQLLDPDGGLLLIHCLLTTQGGQMLVDEVIKREQQNRFEEIEVLGLLEPQRVVQNNVLLIRRISGAKPEHIEKPFTAPADSTFEEDARRLVRG